MRKRSVVFAGFAARTGNERLPKRVMLGELERGKETSEGKSRTGWVVSNATYRCFKSPTEEKQWTLAAKKKGKWFRRLGEAAEQYICMCWLVKEKESVAKRRALEI